MSEERFNDPPWHPMTDQVSVKHLTKLIEELGEATSAAARCLMQGMDGVNPHGGEVNRVWLQNELADVLANINLCTTQFDLSEGYMVGRAMKKSQRLREWHKDA